MMLLCSLSLTPLRLFRHVSHLQYLLSPRTSPGRFGFFACSWHLTLLAPNVFGDNCFVLHTRMKKLLAALHRQTLKTLRIFGRFWTPDAS